MQSKQYDQKYLVTNRSEAGVSVLEVGVLLALLIVVSFAGIVVFGNEVGRLMCESTSDKMSDGRDGFGFEEKVWNEEASTCESPAPACSGFCGT